MIKLKKIDVSAQGYCGIENITDEVSEFLEETDIKQGSALIFTAGSTAGVATIEYEEELLKDMKEFFERQIPSDREYHHDKKWGDDNGFSHIRSALLGTSLTIPIINGKLALGTWQQVVLINFDNRDRKRKVFIQISGE